MTPLQNVWVFGGTGYIGRALVSALSGLPGIRINILLHNKMPFKLLEHTNVFTGDLRNFNFEWFRRYPPSIIFHLARMAGNTPISRYIRASAGAAANRRLLGFLNRENLNPVIVYVSGSLMYGAQTGNMTADENTPLNPVSYGKYYYRAEHPLIDAQINRTSDIRFARPGWIIGPDSWFKTFYWEPWMKTGKVPLYGQGDQLMSLIHIDHCARQIINLAFHGIPYQNLNVFGATPLTQHKFCEQLADVLHSEVSRVSTTELLLKYGKTTVAAFSSSIPMSTLYPHLHNYESASADVTPAINEVVSFLKNKHNIFAESPQKGLV